MSDAALLEGSRPAAAPAAMPAALSLTHQHLLAVVNAELDARGARGPLTMLDVGCGDGRLIEYLVAGFSALRPQTPLDLHGFDVADHGVQPEGYFTAAVERLETATRRPWSDRLKLVSERDPWPYADASLDIQVSNQVLEHVRDHRAFFAETARTLKPGGFSAHLFPLGHVVVEPHLRAPFAHWFGSADGISTAIRLANRVGLGRFAHDPETDLDAYVAAHTDFLVRFTNYRTAGQMIADAKSCGLHASFRYTPHYYVEKLRMLAGRQARTGYERPGAAHAFAALALRYVSNATLLLSREDVYGRPRGAP